MNLLYEKNIDLMNGTTLDELDVTFSLDCVPPPEGIDDCASILIKAVVIKNDKEETYYCCLPHCLPYSFALLVALVNGSQRHNMYGTELDLFYFIKSIFKGYIDNENDIDKFSKALIKKYFKHLLDYILKCNYVSDEKDLFENNKNLFTLSLKEALDI
jgi:hypothetical protein